MYHARAKHIEVQYHVVREKILVRDIDIVYLSIEEHMTDIFTKALGIEKLCMFKGLLSVLKLDLSLRGSVEISR